MFRAVANDGAKFGHGHLGPFGLNQTASAIGQSAAKENEAGIGFGGIENETDRFAGMNANASGENDTVAEGCLKSRLHFLFRLLVPPGNGNVAQRHRLAAKLRIQPRQARGERQGESSKPGTVRLCDALDSAIRHD
jgi:hypothetical protein